MWGSIKLSGANVRSQKAEVVDLSKPVEWGHPASLGPVQRLGIHKDVFLYMETDTFPSKYDRKAPAGWTSFPHFYYTAGPACLKLRTNSNLSSTAGTWSPRLASEK